MEGLEFKKRVNVCFGKNDVRCVAGEELDDEITYRTGKAIVEFLRCSEFIVGHDMRVSSHKLRDAFIRGITDQGADVIDIGVIDSPGLYFASGFLKLPGGMITASHNPAKYNGIKLVKKSAIPIGEKSGLKKIREIVREDKFRLVKRKGKVRKMDLSREYRTHLHSFVDARSLKGLRIVVDAGNGMAGKMVPIAYKGLGVKIVPLDFKLDGRFPTHEANPSKPENIMHLRKKVCEKKADFGIAFDGDMDRVFFVDEKGKAIDSSLIAALLIKHFCLKGRKVNMVYNTVMSLIVPETAKKHGGKAFKEKVGHSYIKARMRKTNSIFGAESSAHYYYKDNWYADSGLITSLLVCEIFSRAKKDGARFSDLLREFERYYKIVERSVSVKDKERVMKLVERKFRKKARKIERSDGLTMEFDWGWFNVRPSNTEPLLRVNLEAESREEMLWMRKELMGFIAKF